MASNDAWKQYVDTCLLETGKVSQGAILGHDGSVWAISNEFSLSSSQEISNLINTFNDPSKARQQGLFIAGIKYVLLRADQRSIYGKNGSTGVICVKTKQTVIVATYGDSHVPGETTTVVENLADYLISSDF